MHFDEQKIKKKVLTNTRVFAILYTERERKEQKKMTRTELENMVREMIREGKPLHGFARDIAEDMALREMEEERKGE